MGVMVVSTFPSLNSSNPRGWMLAGIVLLHCGFFWLLSSTGMYSLMLDPPKKSVIVHVKEKPKQVRRQQEPDVDKSLFRHDEIVVPPVTRKIVVEDDEGIIKGTEVVALPPKGIDSGGTAKPEPIIVQPEADPRTGLSEPVYPSQDIRLGHAGTVILAIQVLENGRVGAVRIENSSGYPRLDESAAREARSWRFKPGTQDGVPVAMWKRIPITFRLNQETRTAF